VPGLFCSALPLISNSPSLKEVADEIAWQSDKILGQHKKTLPAPDILMIHESN